MYSYWWLLRGYVNTVVKSACRALWVYAVVFPVGVTHVDIVLVFRFVSDYLFFPCVFFLSRMGLSIHTLLDFFCIHTLLDCFCSSIASNFAMSRPPAFGLSGSLVARFEHTTSVSRIVARSPYYCTTGDDKPETFFYWFCCGSWYKSSVNFFLSCPSLDHFLSSPHYASQTHGPLRSRLFSLSAPTTLLVFMFIARRLNPFLLLPTRIELPF